MARTEILFAPDLSMGWCWLLMLPVELDAWFTYDSRCSRRRMGAASQ